MKFVQGDAIAGIVIIFVNILGGLYMGLSQGMELSSAAETYTVLTVGDGLVSQIPALLISICAGVVVTRVSSNDGLTLGGDLSIQLFSNPMAIIFTGILLFALALLPGIPFLPFAFVGSAFLGIGFYFLKQPPVGSKEFTSASHTRIPSSSSPLLEHRIYTESTHTGTNNVSPLPSTHEVIKLELGSRAYQLSTFLISYFLLLEKGFIYKKTTINKKD